jgi:xyloglucan-specific exo-beta-1,4-glucanase
MRLIFTTICKTLLATLIFLIPPREGRTQIETYTWQNVAMGGGGFVSGIITSKTEQNLMYARTDVGGAYRWDAVNSRWIPLLDWTSENELGYQGVESIAIDPVEPNKVYMLVGTSYFNNGKTAILRSSDYGNSFAVTEVTNQFKAHGNGMGRQTGEKLVVDPNKNNVLYCGTRENGLFKSTNAGATWTRVTTLNVTTTTNGNGISFVVLDPSAGTPGNETQTIIAGVSRSGVANLYRSDNGGTTFSEIAQAPTSLMPHRAALTSDGSLYITYANNDGPWNISGAGAIWKYNLASGAWTNVTPSGFGGAFGGISVDPSNPQRLVASSVNTYQAQDNSWGDRIFLTTNGGATWIDLVERGFDRDPNGVSWVDGSSIHWSGCVEFDPFDTKKAWIISGNGIFQTDDIDATTNVWKFQVKGLEETVPLDMASIPNGPVVSTIGDYGGFRHEDVTQYAPAHEPTMGTTHGVAYASLSPNVMLRIGHEKMYYSGDMGMTWAECNRTGLDGSVSISADGKILLYSHNSGSGTYRSTDKGNTWTTSTGISITWAKPLADPLNPLKFYAYNPSSGALLISTNGGESFVQAGLPGAGGSKIIRAAPWREGDVWVALYNGGLTRTTNSGQTFTKISGVAYCAAVGFGKEAPGKTYPTIFIYGTVNGISGVHRSTDEGATWIRVNDDAHEYGGPGNGQFVQGDMNTFGRVYMGTVGRGLVYGESDQTCIPTNVVPYTKVNAETKKKLWITTANPGSNVLLSPEPVTGGTWSWSGPDGFTSASREVAISDIQPTQAGIYKVTYTNASGCQSSVQTFTLNVGTETVTSQDPNFHIYLLFGQSNMDGAGTIESQDRTGVDERFQVIGAVTCDGNNTSFTLGKWRTATPPIVRCWSGLGIGDYFGRTMVANLPQKIRVGVVPVAVPGCDIGLFDKVNYGTYASNAPEWMKAVINDYGGNPYARLVEVAKLAQKNGVIKGILFHQGETNTNSTTWKNQVQQVVANLKSDLGLDDVPFLAGELLAAQGACCSSHNVEVNKLPDVIPNAHVISSSGLLGADGAHFTSASYRTFGERYAEKMLQLIEVDTNSVTSAENHKLEGQVDMYPIPVVNGVFTIDNIGDITRIEVFTLWGSKIAAFDNSNRSTSLKIPVNTAQGILLIKFYDRQARVFYKKTLVLE